MLLAHGFAFAQSPAPLARPNLNLRDAGIVYAIARQPDGGVVLAGNFESINGVPRHNVARLRPDGQVDPVWTGPSNFEYPWGMGGSVTELAVDAAGAIYIGGIRWAFGGPPWVVKLSAATGAVDATWRPPSLEHISALAVDRQGDVYVSNGDVYKLSGANGAQLRRWAVDGYVNAIAFAADGSWYAGGSFTTFDGQPRGNLACVRNDALDAGWKPTTDGSVNAVAVDVCGGVAIGGSFLSINGQPRSRIARLAALTGDLQSNWKPIADGEVAALATDPECAVYAGGVFRTIDGLARSRAVKLSAGDGAVDPAWKPAADDAVIALAAGSDGHVLVGGQFITMSGESRLGFAELDATAGRVGTRALADAEFPGFVTHVATQPGGGVIVAGSFAKAGAHSRRNLLRLKPDGTLDSGWDALLSPRTVTALAAGPADEVYVAGGFFTVNGQARSRMAKLAGNTGALDAQWDAAPNGSVDTIVADASGAVYAGGRFTAIGGQPRRGIAKLSGTTGLAVPGWNPSPPEDQPRWNTYVLALDGSGALYASGAFATMGGLARAGIAKISTATGMVDADWAPPIGGMHLLVADQRGRLYAAGPYVPVRVSTHTGAVDTQWNPPPTVGGMESIALDRAGDLYIGGSGGNVGYEEPFRHLARISEATGEVDVSWAPVPNWSVKALAVDVQGTVYVGGAFTTIGGQPRSLLAAFSRERIFDDGFE